MIVILPVGALCPTLLEVAFPWPMETLRKCAHANPCSVDRLFGVWEGSIVA